MASDKRHQRREKRRFLKRTRFYPYVSFILLITLLLMILNWGTFVCSMSPQSYETIDAKVIESGGDALTGVLPRTKFSYMYKGKNYEENRVTLIAEVFYGGVDKDCTLEVNTKAPRYVYLTMPVLENCLNWVLFGLLGFCWGMLIWNIIRRLRHFINGRGVR